MTHPRFLRTIPVALALMLAAAAAPAQTTPPADTTSASATASASAQVDATAKPQDSSDQNIPPATARKQAAEVATGDPQRWYREDATAAARLRTIQKEIAAGLQEAQGNCRRQLTAERTACLKDARAIYQKEMAEARSRAMADTAR
ncbi:hypothetical protein HHL21_11570 [Massilia sp. RP-1-19]|uniref:Uncharacterized protein n=1 Tax=Massilia polaris TaxID=2728846 RepID=A0A848HKY6_9BURK|nr:hypothetical protein [Massilia polaris]NML61707.1 hypothetical protein [Massilia polaris]